MARVAPFLNSRGPSAVASRREVPRTPRPYPRGQPEAHQQRQPVTGQHSSKGQGRLWLWLGDQIQNHRKRPDKACKRAFQSLLGKLRKQDTEG